MRLRAVGLVVAAVAWACAPVASTEEEGAERGAGPLLTSLQATTYADSVAFVLQVTNTSDAPVELVFPSGQSFDFVVERASEEVWRWSAGQMFTQAVRQEVLAPGATRSHRAAWVPPTWMPEGAYRVVGTLATQAPAAEQSTPFELR